MNRHSVTAIPAAKKSENIIATGSNRNTLADITNNKAVIFETSPVKGILRKQEVLSNENSLIITPGKEDTFHLSKESDSNFQQVPECNVLSSVPRRETYNVNKGNTTMPASETPVSESCPHAGTYIVQDERYSVDSLEESVFYDSLEGQLLKGQSNCDSSNASFDINDITLSKDYDAFIVDTGKYLLFSEFNIYI